MRRTPRLFIVIVIIIALVFGVLFAIKFAKGYRPSFSNKAFRGTGLLAANSSPRGASVFINDKLTTATDDTLNLPPGEYQVKIAKDGYIPWEKTLILEPELVTQTNTRLFPSVPDLKPLTFTGALNPTPSPDGQKILFAVENATTDTKNGLYVLELNSNPLSFNSGARQITRQSQKYDFVQANLFWSPDSAQILAVLDQGQSNELNVLLNPSSFNDIEDLKDVTAQLPVIQNEWLELQDKKDHELLIELPEFMQKVATQSAHTYYFNPENDKLLYTPSEDLTIPSELIPPLPASSTQLETRELKANNVYIYDFEEDKNFWITESPILPTNDLETESQLGKLNRRYSPLSPQSIMWFPDSRHIIIVKEDKIIIAEYDGTNRHTVYAGPFANSFAYPWPNGSRLIIMASLNGGSNLPPNLYSINLK